MTARRQMPRWTPASWWMALVVVGVGAVWLTSLLMAAGPGDSGPVVGNSVLEHLQVGVPCGAAIVLAGAVAGWFVALLVDRNASRRRAAPGAKGGNQ